MTVETENVSFAVGEQRRKMPILSGSASVKNGVLMLSLINCHANLPAEVMIESRGGEWRGGRTTVLSDSDITAHNTFERPERIAPKNVSVAVYENRAITLAPGSVTAMSFELT